LSRKISLDKGRRKSNTDHAVAVATLLLVPLIPRLYFNLFHFFL